MNIMSECKFKIFREMLGKVERPTNLRQLSREVGISEITVSKYVAVLEAKGELKTKLLGRQKVIL